MRLYVPCMHVLFVCLSVCLLLSIILSVWEKELPDDLSMMTTYFFPAVFARTWYPCTSITVTSIQRSKPNILIGDYQQDYQHNQWLSTGSERAFPPTLESIKGSLCWTVCTSNGRGCGDRRPLVSINMKTGLNLEACAFLSRRSASNIWRWMSVCGDEYVHTNHWTVVHEGPLTIWYARGLSLMPYKVHGVRDQHIQTLGCAKSEWSASDKSGCCGNHSVLVGPSLLCMWTSVCLLMLLFTCTSLSLMTCDGRVVPFIASRSYLQDTHRHTYIQTRMFTCELLQVTF